MCPAPTLALFLLLLLLFLPSLAPVVQAQSTSASLTGRVVDPSKALIVGARVCAISSGTNSRYETTSNFMGEYFLTDVAPERYRVEVEKSGFKKLIKPDIFLHVQDATEIDFEMPIGDASDSITVQDGAPLVNTESATVSTVIDRTLVDQMPLNGRSFQTLIMLTPGVVVNPASLTDQGQFSVNGQRADANYFTVDGMQEFRTQTSSFAPEFGRTPGGQISVVTRSGTNAFHGPKITLSAVRSSAAQHKCWQAA